MARRPALLCFLFIAFAVMKGAAMNGGGRRRGYYPPDEKVNNNPQLGTPLDGHYFSFKTGGNPAEVVDRFEARQQGNRVTYYRNGPVGSRDRVNSATANAMESYTITGNKLSGPVGATIKANGDIEYTHGYTSRKEV